MLETVVCVLLSLLVVWYVSVPFDRSVQDVAETDGVGESKQELLFALLEELELDYRSGKIEESDYETRRAEYIALLAREEGGATKSSGADSA